MNYPLFLARRLSLSSGGHKSSPAIKVAITAVALSIAVMLAAISIVLGFKREIREKVVGFNSHITLYSVAQSEGDDNLVSLTPSLVKLLDEEDYITDYSLEASIPAILKTPDNFKGVYLRSLSGKQINDFLTKNLEEGDLPDSRQPADSTSLQVVISRIAARQLNLKPGDKIDTYFISDDVRVRKLEITGIFNSHFDSYDDIYLYGSLGLIQELGGIGNHQGTTIQVQTNDFNNLEENTLRLQNRLMEALADGTVYKFYRADNALQQGAGYFRWLSLLDTNVIVILVLMTFVACITLISGMLIIILDKKRFIGLIRSLGARRSKVRSVFIYMALKVAITGMIIGNGLMLLLLYFQNRFHLIPLNPEAYYIDFVPVEFNWPLFGILNLGVAFIIYLSLILPSWFASGISPAETMRYEE
ncbi:MAG: ABC transporter permease [Bacteroidales bacterium]|nr:ABC transporter permease [Bacteroidales bacterium]MBD5189966.1 ABC transporter permease [Bacteroidales bacterium]